MAKHTEGEHLDVGSRIALAGHPIHAVLVHFPIALSVAAVGADLLWWFTADPFFARLALWTIGWGFVLGVVAGIAGTAELLAGPGIRRQAESWTHAIAALMLLATIGANWALRLGDPEGRVLPWGLLLSLGGLLFVGIAGYHGGALVHTHGVGLKPYGGEEEPDED